MEEIEGKSKRWMAATLVVVLIAGGIGALAWYASTFFRGADAGEQLVEIQPERGSGGRRNAGGGNSDFRSIASAALSPQPDGIRKLGDAYIAKSGIAQLRAIANANGAWTITPSYAAPGIATKEQLSLFSASLNSLFLNLSEDQLKQLKAIPDTPPMVVDSAQKDDLRHLWQSYAGSPQGSARSEAETALLKRLAEIGSQCKAPTEAALKERAEKIRAILTKDQLTKLKL